MKLIKYYKTLNYESFNSILNEIDSVLFEKIVKNPENRQWKAVLDFSTINGERPQLKTWKNRHKIKKTKFFYGKQLKLDNNRNVKNSMWNCYSSIRWESRAIFDFKSIPPRLLQWLPIITETSKIQFIMIIPWVLNENRSLFLNLSQHGLQIARDIRLTIKE